MGAAKKILTLALMIIVHGSSAEDILVKYKQLVGIINAFQFSSADPKFYGDGCKSLLDAMDDAVGIFKSQVAKTDYVVSLYSEEMHTLEQRLHKDSLYYAVDSTQFSDDMSNKFKLQQTKNNELANRWRILWSSDEMADFMCSQGKLYSIGPDAEIICSIPMEKVANALVLLRNSSFSDDSDKIMAELERRLVTYEKELVASTVRNVNNHVTTLNTKIIAFIEFLNKKDPLINVLRNLIQDNEKMIESRRSGTARIVALLIDCGDQSTAIKYFNEYKDGQLLREVIENRVKNMDNLNIFLQKIPSGMLKTAMMTAAELQSNGESQVTVEKALSATLKIIVDLATEDWISQLLANEMRHIIKDSRLYEKPFGAVLPHVVRKAYGKEQTNAIKLVESIVRLPLLNHRLIGLSALMDEMVKNHHFSGDDLIAVGLLVKRSSKGIKAINSISKKLPDGVRALLFDSYVRLWSRHTEYALSCSPIGSVFTFPESDNKSQYWYVERKFYDVPYFRFRNMDNMVLYADKEGHAHCRSSADTNDDELWRVMAIGDAQPQYFYLQDKANRYILDSDNFLKKCIYEHIDKCSLVHTYGEFLKNHIYHQWSFSITSPVITTTTLSPTLRYDPYSRTGWYK